MGRPHGPIPTSPSRSPPLRSFLGTVEDSSGALVSHAIVVLRPSTNRTPIQTETDSSGGFHLEKIPLGSYTLTVAAPAFKDVTILINFKGKRLPPLTLLRESRAQVWFLIVWTLRSITHLTSCRRLTFTRRPLWPGMLRGSRNPPAHGDKAHTGSRPTPALEKRSHAANTTDPPTRPLHTSTHSSQTAADVRLSDTPNSSPPQSTWTTSPRRRLVPHVTVVFHVGISRLSLSAYFRLTFPLDRS